jgi:hypothetical protein
LNIFSLYFLGSHILHRSFCFPWIFFCISSQFGKLNLLMSKMMINRIWSHLIMVYYQLKFHWSAQRHWSTHSKFVSKFCMFVYYCLCGCCGNCLPCYLPTFLWKSKGNLKPL